MPAIQSLVALIDDLKAVVIDGARPDVDSLPKGGLGEGRAVLTEMAQVLFH